jgi:hypothetical protein
MISYEGREREFFEQKSSTYASSSANLDERAITGQGN